MSIEVYEFKDENALMMMRLVSIGFMNNFVISMTNKQYICLDIKSITKSVAINLKYLTENTK